MSDRDTEEANVSVDGEPFDRTHVVFVRRRDDRGHPYLILSTETYPEQGRRYLAIPITSATPDNGITIDQDDWSAGGIERPSYALPAQITRISHEEIEVAIGAVDAKIADEAVTHIGRYLGIGR